MWLSVSLTDINQRKPYKSHAEKDQQVVSRKTIPYAIVETYTGCDPPPALDKLDVYRYDFVKVQGFILKVNLNQFLILFTFKQIDKIFICLLAVVVIFLPAMFSGYAVDKFPSVFFPYHVLWLVQRKITLAISN